MHPYMLKQKEKIGLLMGGDGVWEVAVMGLGCWQCLWL